MSFAAPLWLAGLLPVAALAWALWRQAPMLVPSLPGGWARLIEPPLRRFMARDLSRPGLGQVWLCLGIAACLVVAMARPLIPLGTGTDYANMVGRVILIDADQEGIAERRIAVDRFLELSPEVPTSLVAVAGDAYMIVPFTTDAAQIDRYLRVLEPDAMPMPGLAVHTGLALGEKIIADAGVVAGQIVLIAGPRAPDAVVELPGTETLRAFVVAGGTGGWQTAAGGYAADLIDIDAPGEVTATLDREIEKLRAGLPGAAIDMAPWLMALAMLLCLGLFRRRSAA